jgi:hypothetical protein
MAAGSTGQADRVEWVYSRIGRSQLYFLDHWVKPTEAGLGDVGDWQGRGSQASSRFATDG